MARIFTYIIHKGGVVDDSAAELVAAARRIDRRCFPTAIVTGCGAELDAVCEVTARFLRWRYGKSPTRLWPIPMLN